MASSNLFTAVHNAASVKAEFIKVGLKAACTHLSSSVSFLSDDETKGLKGNFRSLFFFPLFALQNPCAVAREGAEGHAVRPGFRPRHYIQCLIL